MNEPDLYGIPVETIALLCKVHIRTARRWKNGERKMPETARMILAGDLGAFDPAWRGWAFRDGKLISPEGWEVSPGDVLSLQLMRAQISAYQAKERQIAALEEQPLPGTVPVIVTERIA
jgi:Phage protein